MSFEHAFNFWLLTAVIPLSILLFFVIKQKQKIKKLLGDTRLVDALTSNYSPGKFRLKYLLLTGAFVLMCFAVANLHKLIPSKDNNRAGIDVMIALDVSKSMYAEDAKPSRLELAKNFINQLVPDADNNRIGLVVFAGQAYLQMPLTSDVAVTALYVSNASPEAIPAQGTMVADALKVCNQSLDTKENKYKAVVLISDGEDHDPGINEAIQKLYDNGVVVYTVGVGSTSGSMIKEPGSADYKIDNEGKTVISRLNEKELVNIASKTGGTYTHLVNAVSDAQTVAGHLNSMEKKLIQQQGANHSYLSFFPLFLLPALIILLVETYISETKKIKTS